MSKSPDALPSTPEREGQRMSLEARLDRLFAVSIFA